MYFHILYDFSYVSRHFVNILSITLKFFLMPDLALLLEITEPEVDSSPLQKVVFKGV